MIKINKTEISITRGDSAYINFDLRNNRGDAVQLLSSDVVRCQVRDDVDGNLIFEGRVTKDSNGTITWCIKPEDTADCSIGTYYWDAQVEFGNGDIFTFVNVSKFNVLPEITMDEE